MTSLLKLSRLLLAQQFGRQRLLRRPEPVGAVGTSANVAQYDRALESKLAVTYAVALELIQRTRESPRGGNALDLGCGPGHFSLSLASRLGFDSVTGVDLSTQMIARANLNAERAPARGVRFVQGDMRWLDNMATASFDVVSLNMAAHHLDDLDSVTGVVREMERLAGTSGVVFVLDLARLRTARITDRYVDIVAADYHALGLDRLLDEFRDSMRAAWTVAELRRAVPSGTNRTWWQVVPPGLPLVQVLIGVPSERPALFLRRAPVWPLDDHPVPKTMRGEWRLLRVLLAMGTRRVRESEEGRRT